MRPATVAVVSAGDMEGSLRLMNTRCRAPSIGTNVRHCQNNGLLGHLGRNNDSEAIGRGREEKQCSTPALRMGDASFPHNASASTSAELAPTQEADRTQRTSYGIAGGHGDGGAGPQCSRRLGLVLSTSGRRGCFGRRGWFCRVVGRGRVGVCILGARGLVQAGFQWT